MVEFRSKGRIPVLCWKQKDGEAVITRGSQPSVGIRGNSCKEDEALIKAIIDASPRERSHLSIIDARPKVNAVGNKMKGLGYEEDTQFCTVEFMGIENIHNMRESFNKVFELLNKDKQFSLPFLSRGKKVTFLVP